MHFYIIADSIVLDGSRTLRYAILKQSANIFQFVNQNGEVVKLVKSVDKTDNEVFYKYILDFGFNSRTGIELTGEEKGILYPVNRCEPHYLQGV